MRVGEKVGDEVPGKIDLKVDWDKDKSHFLYNSIMVNCVFQPFPIGAVSNLVHIHTKITHKRLSLFRWFTKEKSAK